MKKLWKSMLVIWSEFDPHSVEPSRLAEEADSGDALCSKLEATLVANPILDPDFPDTDFFGADDD